MNGKKILYVGGFQLPDKNAAAFRVLTNAKALRVLGYQVIFLNALIDYRQDEPQWVDYEGFKCLNYKREKQREYLLSAKRMIAFIRKIEADVVIAYNYPAVALNNVRKYCQRHDIQCIADATEWYIPTGNILFKFIKGCDTELRMRYVQPKMDGVIAISDYLYQYYKDKIKTVKIPPLVDLEEDKWKIPSETNHKELKLIYAGSPSAQKERLDLIVDVVEWSNLTAEVHLDVLGLTQEEFNEMYRCHYTGNRVTFWGKVSNIQVIKMTKESDWAIVLREKNKVVEAGFPTKIPEAIACGIPVIANRFSNIEEYLDNSNSILIDCVEDFSAHVIEQAKINNTRVERELFHYVKFIDIIKKVL